MYISSLEYGDIVVVPFPYSDRIQIKVRPALVVQANNLKTGISQVILAEITSKMERAKHPCRVSVRLNDPSSKGTGLLSDSVIMTDQLATVETSIINKKIGHLPDMKPVQSALRVTLNLP